jgi:hypothetical protein
MSESSHDPLSHDPLTEQSSERPFWRSVLSLKGFACLALAAAAIPASFSAFNSSDSGSGVDLPLSQIQGDLATESEAEKSTGKVPEPARLTTEATSSATDVALSEESGPLFGDPLDVASVTDGSSAPIEVTRFRAATTQRVQANQAVWLTGSIEPIE